jgi:hypothetical protein
MRESWLFGEVPPVAGSPAHRSWVQRNVRFLLFLTAIVTVAWGAAGCAVLDWYPDGKIPEPCGAAHRATLAACKVDGTACAEAKAAEALLCAPQTTPTKGQEGDGKPAPAPEPPPGPLTCANLDCAPGHHCQDSPSGPRCVKDDPQPQCSATLSRACWHDPDGQGWRFRCQDGVTDAKAPESCPAPPVEQPVVPPAVGCTLDGVIDPDALEGIEPRPTIPAKLAADVNEVELAAGGCDNCVVGPYDPWVAKVAEGLRARGWCVGTRIHPDAIAVSDPDDLSINYAIHVHLAGGGAGRARWMPSAYVDAWRVKAATPAPPAGPAVTSCPPPVPLRAYEDGNPHWFLKCKPHVPGWVIDCTPKVIGQPDYCEAVHGKRDLNCDIRPEGTLDREACEATLYGDTVTESRNGADCSRWGTNPMQFGGNNANCRLCSTSKPKVCSDWF